MNALAIIQEKSEIVKVNKLNQTVYLCTDLFLNEQTLPFIDYLARQNSVVFFNEYDFDSYMKSIDLIDDLDELLNHLNLYEHAYRTSHVVYAVMEYLNYDTTTIQTVAHATLLHDIGKLCISQSLLNSQSRFNYIKKEYVKLHCKYGKQTLKYFDIPEHVKLIAMKLAQNHHERIDGSGYPHGKKELELSTLDRIIAIADVYSAVTENRPYRSSVDNELALSLLKNPCKFDQKIVNILEKLLQYKIF